MSLVRHAPRAGRAGDRLAELNLVADYPGRHDHARSEGERRDRDQRIAPIVQDHQQRQHGAERHELAPGVAGERRERAEADDQRHVRPLSREHEVQEQRQHERDEEPVVRLR